MLNFSVALVATQNYLHHALTTHKLLVKHNPALEQTFILIPDANNNDIRQVTETVGTVYDVSNLIFLTPEDCGFDKRHHHAFFYYNAEELSCSLKPIVLKYINEQTDTQRWLYLDSDIYCTGCADELIVHLDQVSILLTTHRSRPGANAACDMVFLSAGCFNAGVIGIKRSEASSRFIQWFGERLSRHCFDDWRADPEDRINHKTLLFSDQKWLTLAPLFFEQVLLSRERRFNLSYWNIDSDQFSFADGRLYCKNEPVVFLHLSKLNLETPHYWMGCDLSTSESWRQVMSEYLSTLEVFSALPLPDTYRYATYKDGEPISLRERRAYFKLIADTKEINADPFDPSCRNLLRKLSASSATYDYISPGLQVVQLESHFRQMVEIDKYNTGWRYTGMDNLHKCYADIRYPNYGFTNMDEAHILYNTASQFEGQEILEVGCWMGWSSAHLASAGVKALHIMDPVLDQIPWRDDVRAALASAGVAHKCVYYANASPGGFYSLPQQAWPFIFIDADHSADNPLTDVVHAAAVAGETATIMLHDLRSPGVSAALAYLKRNGWKTGLYLTAQVMGCAWRGGIDPITHYYDRLAHFSLPYHLDEFSILSK